METTEVSRVRRYITEDLMGHGARQEGVGFIRCHFLDKFADKFSTSHATFSKPHIRLFLAKLSLIQETLLPVSYHKQRSSY
jgi:hypothetical protein